MLKKLLFPCLLILAGCSLAYWVQTDGGQIDVSDIRFPGADGNVMSALLYRPEAATAANPHPGVLAVHGYINSRETQSGFAIELARNGFVVLALDQTGHGYSDPPAFAHGFGGPAGLAYLRSLDFVDSNRIGLEGHSMGGWTVQMAAADQPDGYAAMVLAGSSTGTFGAPDGTAETPRNLLLVFSLYDEFSDFMWGAPVPADIVDTPKLKTLFGAQQAVVTGQEYGDVSTGTARMLLMPAVTHPGDHISTEAIGMTVDWFHRLLGDTANGEGIMGQTWYLKELGTLLALVGLAWMIFPLSAMVFDLPSVRQESSPELVAGNASITNLLITCLLPILTFFPLQTIANLVLPANSLFSQQITNGILLWAWGTGIFSVMMFAWWLKQSELTLARVGFSSSGWVRYLSAAVIVTLCVLVVVALSEALLNVDFRFWVVAMKAPSMIHVGLIFIYLPLFAVFFLVLSLSLISLGQAATSTRTMWRNGFLLASGYVLMLLIQYLPLFAGGTLAIASQPLLTIVAIQFAPLMCFVGMLVTFLYQRSGSVWPGTFLVSMLVTWYVVAGTATQAVPFWLL